MLFSSPRKFFSGQAIALPYGAKCEVSNLIMSSGGGGTNTAVGFSRLGLKTAVVARCGWDFAGKLIRKEMIKEGVDDSLLVQNENEDTDYSTILLSADGNSTVLVYRGETRLEPTEIPWPKLKAKWFYLASLEGNLELLSEIITFAKKQKIRVAINPGRREIEKKGELLQLIKEVDILIINQEEAAKLANLTNFELNLFKKTSLISQGGTVVTCGANGVMFFGQENKFLESEAFRVEMVDATGAGDAFGCGFVAGLVKWWEVKDCLKLGAANGASQVTEIGAKKGLLYEKNIHNWLNKPLKIS